MGHPVLDRGVSKGGTGGAIAPHPHFLAEYTAPPPPEPRAITTLLLLAPPL